VLAADYKALLSEYLGSVGGVLVPGACRGLAADTEAELRSVGSLLATRCEAYKVLYEQLVRRVGAEGGGRNGSGGGAPCLIFNTNSNRVDACPVTNNFNQAIANAKAKALQAGLGPALVAAAAFGAGLLLRALINGRSGGRATVSDGRGGRVPLPKGGREMALVSALSVCGDELRKAERNESLLHDDWRIGRTVRIAWPPAPEPPGYAPLVREACDITGVLQGLYGR